MSLGIVYIATQEEIDHSFTVQQEITFDFNLLARSSIHQVTLTLIPH
jgi:hypothetical protein